MWVYLIIALVLLFIVGNLLVLLRTARKPKIPDNLDAKPYQDDDDDESGW